MPSSETPAELVRPSGEPFEASLSAIERRESHLWTLTLVLLLVLAAVTVVTFSLVFAAQESEGSASRNMTLIALVGLSLLIVLFCAYVLTSRATFNKIRHLFESQAVRDSLTGLLNRRYFDSRIEAELRRSDRSQSPVALMLCDLDNFKAVNDTHGHHRGDEVLQAVAKRLLQATRGSDLVFRWGGDEMLVVLAPTTRDGVSVAAGRVRDGVREIHRELGITIDLSIGIALYPEHGRNPDTLLRLADRALYIAKKSGDKIHVGEEELPLDGSAVKTVFQRLVDERTGGVVGYEALSRDPAGELAIVDLFKRYEAVGQLGDLKSMIFRRQLALAEKLGLERVFINVDFALLAATAPCDKPEGMDVVLEISESEAMRNLTRNLQIADAWRARGFKFAIDDFGSALISLPFIARLVPDFIKVARSTILKAADSEEFTGFLRDLMSALRGYSGDGFIAEGIETKEELETARKVGVSTLQGFLFGQPESLDD